MAELPRLLRTAPIATYVACCCAWDSRPPPTKPPGLVALCTAPHHVYTASEWSVQAGLGFRHLVARLVPVDPPVCQTDRWRPGLFTVFVTFSAFLRTPEFEHPVSIIPNGVVEQRVVPYVLKST